MIGLTPLVRNSQRNHHCLDSVRSRREEQYCRLIIATLNIGILTGKGRKIAAAMSARKIEILCWQEIG